MVKALIVESQGLLRDMLKISLEGLSGIEVLEAVSDGNAAVAAAGLLNPEVVLIDAELDNEPNGIETARMIKSANPDVGIMILSSLHEWQYLRRVSSMEDSSGWSFLFKESVGDAQALARAIEGAASGLIVMNQVTVNNIRLRRDPVIERLTPRQRETLDWVSQGYNNAGIAEKMFVGVKSVENYINVIYQELDIKKGNSLHPRVQAVLSYLKGAPYTQES